ncbi:hypothetical protein KP509_19G046300 [Ceratopteris richardii]|uniref:Uncharacterized protein n=1 Tax=Ceratopteris richardii TaxID=49495 RepID=A0A8T2SP71_CERRI|nr:hypothetical protein KP509_19G046300 [Ceratopteris richardii]
MEHRVPRNYQCTLSVSKDGGGRRLTNTQAAIGRLSHTHSIVVVKATLYLASQLQRSSVCIFAVDYSPEDDASYERLKVGSPVMITEAQPFLKTAEPMPMMRPNRGVVMFGDVGRIISRKRKHVWAVRVKAGAFLLDLHCFKPIEEQS